MTAQLIEGDPASGLLIVADHASAAVPGDIDLGVPAWLLADHVAIDIGVAPLAAALCSALRCAAVLGGVSRLVIDLNREEDAPGLVPVESDGHRIAGNADLSAAIRAERLDRFWRPYHALLAERIATDRPRLIVSLHSFTPSLASRPDEARPWQVGVLWNNDDRAARIALPLLGRGRGRRWRQSALFGQAAQRDDEPPCRRDGDALSRPRGAAGSDRRRRRGRPLGGDPRTADRRDPRCACLIAAHQPRSGTTR